MVEIKDYGEYLKLKNWMKKQASFDEQYITGNKADLANVYSFTIKKINFEFALQKNSILFKIDAYFHHRDGGKIREQSTCIIPL